MQNNEKARFTGFFLRLRLKKSKAFFYAASLKNYNAIRALFRRSACTVCKTIGLVHILMRLAQKHWNAVVYML
jgi:hypothetical protein